MTDLKRSICDLIDHLAPALLDVSHAIHEKPELAFQEREAAALLMTTLDGRGLQVTPRAYGLETAFECSFGAGETCVALLAEYDALPGIGHACGHNLIATASLGAALALAALGEQLPGRVRLLGTPAEESGCGKELMARAGAFEGVDAALMIHPSSLNLASMPSICVSKVKVVYHGRSAHASASPHQGVNALDAMVTSYQAIAQLRQHIRPSERIHGIFTEAGTAANVVPERTAAEYMVRAGDAKSLAALKTRVQACLESGALATGCRLEMQWDALDYLDMRANEPLATAFQTNAESLGIRFDSTEEVLRRGGLGSTDMGNVSYRVPAIHPLLACSPPGVSIHNPEFAAWARSEQGDLAALNGAKALAMTALDLFLDPDLRAGVAGAFERV